MVTTPSLEMIMMPYFRHHIVAVLTFFGKCLLVEVNRS
jgi:hypothetical protein